ncbi:MAG TPA: hypothetical protein VGD39_19585 [Nocardioides sp.]
MGRRHVDLELVTPDAIHRADDGTEYVVERVTQQDVDLARRISGSPESQGRGTPGDEVRDATARVPNLWFDLHLKWSMPLPVDDCRDPAP